MEERTQVPSIPDTRLWSFLSGLYGAWVHCSTTGRLAVSATARAILATQDGAFLHPWFSSRSGTPRYFGWLNWGKVADQQQAGDDARGACFGFKPAKPGPAHAGLVKYSASPSLRPTLFRTFH